MALINVSNKRYYTGKNFGGYQFTSLNDIIDHFMVVYVGEDKIIPKARRTDVAFHAQRAMQELSFDTFKSCKAQEITVPPSLQMVLPQDYVNYTKIRWVDSAGIKHLLYPTNKTSNPFKIQQDSDLNYDFSTDTDVLIPNSDFSSALDPINNWDKSSAIPSSSSDAIGVVSGQLEFLHNTQLMQGSYSSRHHAVWQEVDVSGEETMTISADGLSSASSSGKGVGTVRIGISTLVDFNQTSATIGYNPNKTNPNLPNIPSRNGTTGIYNLTTLSGDPSYIEFNSGNGTLTSGTITEIDVSNETTVYLLITSDGGHNASGSASGTNAVDNVEIILEGTQNSLQYDSESTTWSNYKSNTPSENINNNYNINNDIYETNVGQRYGLDPQHAQVNGSFYIDCSVGKIHFSSNISGKTIVLDYISDSLGTDKEMQVHKFAEEAMYKWITHAVLSSKVNTPEYIVARFKKERFAAIRNAKLRLSNIKLEEITQILRGKSKQIKH